MKKSEWYRQKWSIGQKVQVYSSYNNSFDNATIVDDISDIVIILFENNKATKCIDRYQTNIIKELENNIVSFNDKLKKHQSVPSLSIIRDTYKPKRSSIEFLSEIGYCNLTKQIGVKSNGILCLNVV